MGEYTLPWILERVPDVYDLAEFHGVQKNLVDKWRNHTLKAIPSFFDQLFQNDIDYLDFSIVTFIRRFRHLDNFENIKELILKKYNSAYSQNHNLAKVDPKEIQNL